MEAASYSAHHIAGSKTDAQGVLSSVQSYVSDVERHIDSLASTVDGHLWMQPGFAKYLWHARRIEHALLTYRVHGVMAERVSSESEVTAEVERPKPQPKAERGPIIVCLDTSGSMHGEPEIVANSRSEAMRALSDSLHQFGDWRMGF